MRFAHDCGGTSQINRLIARKLFFFTVNIIVTINRKLPITYVLHVTGNCSERGVENRLRSTAFRENAGPENDLPNDWAVKMTGSERKAPDPVVFTALSFGRSFSGTAFSASPLKSNCSCKHYVSQP